MSTPTFGRLYRLSRTSGPIAMDLSKNRSYLMGRSGKCDVSINVTIVSRKQCVLEWNEELQEARLTNIGRDYPEDPLVKLVHANGKETACATNVMQVVKFGDNIVIAGKSFELKEPKTKENQLSGLQSPEHKIKLLEGQEILDETTLASRGPFDSPYLRSTRRKRKFALGGTNIGNIVNSGSKKKMRKLNSPNGPGTWNKPAMNDFVTVRRQQIVNSPIVSTPEAKIRVPQSPFPKSAPGGGILSATKPNYVPFGTPRSKRRKSGIRWGEYNKVKRIEDGVQYLVRSGVRPTTKPVDFAN